MNLDNIFTNLSKICKIYMNGLYTIQMKANLEKF